MYNPEEQEKVYSTQEKSASVLLGQIRQGWGCLSQPQVEVEKLAEIKGTIDSFRDEHKHFLDDGSETRVTLLNNASDRYGEWFLALRAELRLLEFKIKIKEQSVINPSDIPSEGLVKNLLEFYQRNPIEGSITKMELSSSLKEILQTKIQFDFDPIREYPKDLETAYEELRLYLGPNPFSENPQKGIDLQLLSDQDYKDLVKQSINIFENWANQKNIHIDKKTLPQSW